MRMLQLALTTYDLDNLEEVGSEELDVEKVDFGQSADPDPNQEDPPWNPDPEEGVEKRSFPCILVAEDNKLARDALTELLEDDGYTVIAVRSGADVVIEVSSADYDIGAILMDIIMPGDFDGIEAASQIQQHLQRDIPLIFVTAYDENPVYRQRVIDENIVVTAWLGKPTNYDDLLALLGNLEMEYALRFIETALHQWISLRSPDKLEELVNAFAPELLANAMNRLEVSGHDLGDFPMHVNRFAFKRWKVEQQEAYADHFIAFLNGKPYGPNQNKDSLIRSVYKVTGRTDIFVTKIRRTVKFRHPKRVFR